jgi:hypothetical protein
VWADLTPAQFATKEGLEAVDNFEFEALEQLITAEIVSVDPAKAVPLLGAIPPRLRVDARAQRLASLANGAAATALWSEVVRAAVPLSTRAQMCETARRYAEVAGGLAAPHDGASLPVEATNISAAAVASECERLGALLREEQARQVARREAEERRAALAAEEARQRQARRREAAERAWSSARLLCRDGSLSPSCTCAGSRRGCCSHHGGVAGCSAAEP